MKLVPGVIDTNQTRDVTNPNAIANITINGNTAAKNFSVDGITDMDTGSNGTLHYEPNMDSVQEVKVLSSNYQAEFGRNSGGTITVVTKSGTQSFHGSGWWNHRHEGLNANDWFNKQNFNANTPNAVCTGCYGITPRQKYRYNVDGYSIGGPIYIPGHVNTDKKKLFFFFSQEYTGQLATNALQQKTVPSTIEDGIGTTAAECGGVAGCSDFSQQLLSNGCHFGEVTNSTGVITGGGPGGTQTTTNNCKGADQLVVPGTATNFAVGSNGFCCVIPAGMISPQGQAMLEYFPLPNFIPTGSNANQFNFQAQSPAQHARRNDTLRVDVNPTSKLTAYFRYINDHDDMASLFNGISFIGNEARGNGQTGNPVDSIDHPNPGHGYAGSAIWTISPTLVNEFTVGEDWNTWSWYFSPASLGERSRNSTYNPGLNPPTLFDLPTSPKGVNGYDPLLPAFQFGSDLPNMTSYTDPGTDDYFNANTIWTFEDNVSKVVGQHQFKTGFYYETNTKIQPAGVAYAGAFNFTTDSQNPNNAGDGFANAILGNFDTYSQQSKRTVFNVTYQNLEFYVQDNWRVTRRLTLDLGIRFYHQSPQIDTNDTFAEFVPSLFDATPSGVPRIFVPACAVAYTPPATCPSASQRSTDPGTPGSIFPVSYVGSYVPATGNPANGMHVLGQGGVPQTTYNQSWLAPGPRIGFAYDVFGDGKTAIRGGFGAFFNRLDGNQVYNMSGQPPAAFTEADNQDSLTNLATNGTGQPFALPQTPAQGVIAPGSVNFFGGKVPWDTVRNGSLGIQQNVGFSTVVDVSWVGNFGRHSAITKNLNPVALGADFLPANISAVTGKSLTQNGSVLERTVYPGWQNITQEYFGGYVNYNALDVSVQRRLSNGFLIGGSYTISKALGVTAFDPLVPNNNQRNYGPTSVDRRQNLLINYSYDLPNLGQKMDNKFVGAVLDHWTFSGLTTLQSGAPINPTFTSSSSADITGTTSETPRPNYLGGAKNLQAINFGACTGWGSPGPGTVFVFNPCAFAPPTQGTATGCSATCLGTVTNGDFYGKGLDTWDLTLEKRIPVGKNERRAFRLQFQAYNAFNHPQFITVNSTATYSASITGLTVNSQSPNNSKFGEATGDSGYRILSLNLRFEF